MPPTRRTLSSDLSRAWPPRKNPVSVGRDQPKSRSGSHNDVYKSVDAGGTRLTVPQLGPKRSPMIEKPRSNVDSLFPNPSAIGGIHLDDAFFIEEPMMIVQSSSDQGEPDKATAEATSSVKNPGKESATPSRSSRSPPRSGPEAPVNLSEWGLPERLVYAYQKIGLTTLFPWQAECLNRRKVLSGGNLVYSAPTSAGKTLVAEILLLKRVVETKKKGLFILPFIALAREKMLNLQRIFKGTGVRIDGYMGHLHPRAGLALLDIAVCTFEKANSLINRMVSEKKLDQLGVIVVDELHMVGDPGRGYIIELLLSKVRYLNQIRAQSDETQETKLRNSIQIIGMSATLPNLDVVAKWLDADLYITDYRPVPLQENVKLGRSIYNKKLQKIREVTVIPSLQQNDPDHIVSLCYETAHAGHGVLVFCPSKKWCESLAEMISKGFTTIKANSIHGLLNLEKSKEVVAQLRQSPAGLDQVLGRTVPLGVAFHHAGLTMDEREIVEGAFRKGYIRVLVATTTLSCGVNLPARRVIIRSPMFQNSLMDVLTYHQMAGRAGRKGVDTQGESILMCKDSEKNQVVNLFATSMRPVSSCLIPCFDGQVDTTMLRAVLEIIANGAAKNVMAVTSYFDCLLFSALMETGSSAALARTIVDSLKASELVVIAADNESLHPSQLGNAVIWAGLSPNEGWSVYQELERARLQFNLETELHILYLVTPLHLLEHVSGLDWYHYLLLWERLPNAWKRVGNLIGVEEQSLTAAVRGRLGNESDPEIAKRLACLRRFYCALILNELVNEVSLMVVAQKYQVNKGMLQSLQQGASSYAGMLTVFCNELGWKNMGLLIDQFQSRLMFGVQRELVELIRIQFLSARQARLLYQSGYKNLTKLGAAEKDAVRDILISTSPFSSKNNIDNVAIQKDNSSRNANNGSFPIQKHGKRALLNGLDPMTEEEAANIIIGEAQRLLENDMEALKLGLGETKAMKTV